MKRLLPGKGFCGYILYTAAVLLLMLWLQFPSSAVKAKAESELNRMLPVFAWRIGSVGLTLPADIRFSQIRISSKDGQESLLVIDSLSLRPDFAAWQKTRSWSALWRLQALGGGGSGKAALRKDRSGLEYSGELNGIQLDSPGLKKILAGWGRTAAGSLSGSFSGRQDGQHGLFAEFEGRFSTTKGTVSLQKPVLGMKELTFDSLNAVLRHHQDRLLHVEAGKATSRLLEAEFSGTVSLHPADFSLSQLRLNGQLALKSEFLASIGSSLAASLLQTRLQDGGKLLFDLVGPVSEPGIIFAGLSPDFNSQLGGGDDSGR
ncbi:type II secretion system protein GspN [Candidatus Electronema sp. TJ]|uniref:type II secretion system protein GspN n=1 Tax=Candidatus Electronema sp. TJ TaxID=3401573 RepID=UPI003AA9C23C